MVQSALHASDVRWPEISAEELIRQARGASAEIISVSRFSHAAQPRRPVFTWSMRMLSASLAMVLVAAVALWSLLAPARYETGIGEQRSIVLDDGSMVMLNTASQIEVKYTKQHRSIRLVRGEALFEVAKDAVRPFEVSVGAALVRAVGTQFNIYRRSDRATVTVVEGKVKVIPKRTGTQATAPGSNQPAAEPPSEVITAAERVIVTASGMSEPEHLSDLTSVTAWTQRQLVFENRPLAEVADEFNRYNRQRILIDSNALQSQQVTGVFQANDSASFLAFISGLPGVSVRANERGDHVVSLDASPETNGGPN
jgi:transmembrane sensor